MAYDAKEFLQMRKRSREEGRGDGSAGRETRKNIYVPTPHSEYIMYHKHILPKKKKKKMGYCLL